MVKFLEYLLIAGCMALLLVISHWIGQQAYSWMPVEATAEAQKVDSLFSFLVSVGAFIFLALVGMMIYSMLFFRAPKEDYTEGHPSRGDVRLEILWTVTPTLLVMWIAFQGFNIYRQLDILGLRQIVHLHTPVESATAYAAEISPDAAPLKQPADETIEVFVKQWDWSFRYPNNINSQELHLPVNRRTRLNMHAQEVIHGFYVPEFRLKQDIIPGRNIDLVVTPIRVGKYQLKDSQFSGTYFSLMDADVYVEPIEKYNQWLTQVTNQPMTIKNQAVAEYSQPPKTLFKTSWYTVAPAESSIANQRKVSNDT
ncbi:MAG: cytochrome c oxidase subunit II [Nostoc sp. ZfuVER08]|uniref:Cytochrome c oxidase subunit 2 n=1 Tax=Nostoc punctiforme FACHB-252 TaxID=1357509 RepID=A0ABR8HIG7_NOSPU|nr:cytochrome c oxidase subunit II [Nostoc punctiforme]MBD2615172.1 cytochrome c oxidase subunit II [Nostoc punctiforme FACHB-252]MBL1200226.1 cytochrome c oxidase subunit II [Nostoc sp. GBBB01]MDZ8012052.1 cytochrome c oxidase subunit II [Nostoc sp. ZfuVER08]